MSTEHPRHKLVDEFTNPVRFSLVAGLAGVEQGGEVLCADVAVIVPGVQAVEHGALDGVE